MAVEKHIAAYLVIPTVADFLIECGISEISY